MNSSASKPKISLVAIVTIIILLLVISGVAIYAIVSRPAATQTQDQSTNTESNVLTSESIQQDVSDMDAAVKKEAEAYSATKSAFEDKDKIKVTN